MYWIDWSQLNFCDQTRSNQCIHIYLTIRLLYENRQKKIHRLIKKVTSAVNTLLPYVLQCLDPIGKKISKSNLSSNKNFAMTCPFLRSRLHSRIMRILVICSVDRLESIVYLTRKLGHLNVYWNGNNFAMYLTLPKHLFEDLLLEF